MIDTIKLLIPVKDQAVIDQINGTLERFRKDDLRTGENKFEFFSRNIELGSYNRTVAIRHSKVPVGFSIEFSVPKYLKGNNVEMIYPHEIPAMMPKLYAELCEVMKCELPPYSEWLVYRLDICYNWLLKDKNEVTYAMDFLRRIDFPRKKKITYETSVMMKGTAYSLKFYAKGPEFRAHDFKEIEPELAHHLQSWADRIVRFEVCLRKSYFKDFFLQDRINISDISDDETILGYLKYFLEEKFFCYVNPQSMTDENIKKILFDAFTKRKALALYQFNKNYYFNDEMKNMITDNLNPSTIWRYKKDLKSVGIGISTKESPETEHILKKLIIPSPYSQFDLIDYQFTKA